MVRLFRGVARGRGRQIGRPPFMNLPMIHRQMRPSGFEPEIPPFVRTPMGRGRMPRPGPPRPLRLPLPPRMAPGPPPLRPALPPYSEVPHHMRPPLGIRPGMPPIHHPMPMIPPGPPLRRPMRTGPRTERGRGMLRRGVGLKRLGTSANGKVKKPQKRKEKTEGQFFCEGCDKGWKTQEQLDSHLAEHQVCERDGCSFTAHPKILLKHVQLQHDTGLYLRILKSNPADVEKWIAERKSRFPTKENVAKSKAQKEEMVDRGERIPKQEKRFQNRDNFVSWKRQHQEGNSKPTSNSYAQSPRHSHTKGSKSNFTTHKWRDPDAWKGDLPRFAGTSAFPKEEVDLGNGAMDGVQYSDEDDVEESKTITPTKVEKPQLSGVLAILAADYGSDMSEDDMESCINAGDISNKTTESTSLPNHEECLPEKGPNEEITTSSVQEDNDSDSGPEEKVVDREDKSNIPSLTAEKEIESNENIPKQDEQRSKITQVDSRKTRPVRQTFRPKQPFTLLEKLLKNEIRHERNVILQCVRYVVKTNFLGNGSLAK